MTSTNKRDGGEVELAIKWCVRQAGDPANAAWMVTLLAIAEMLDKQERALAESRAEVKEWKASYQQAADAYVATDAQGNILLTLTNGEARSRIALTPEAAQAVALVLADVLTLGIPQPEPPQ